MYVIGITGGIGCGKSTVADICRKAGLPVIDADEISRQVTASGGSAIPEIISAFGKGAIDARGALDRQTMAKKVFHDHRALDQLSQIIHRQVIELMSSQVEKLAKKNARVVVLDVPIPVKQGFLNLCDQVWVVWADDAVRLERLEARGMDQDEARRRITMQMSRKDYTDLADHVIENNGSEAELTEKVRYLLETELSRRGIRILQSQKEPADSESNVEPKKDDVSIS